LSTRATDVALCVRTASSLLLPVAWILRATGGPVVSVLDLIISSLLTEGYLFTCSPMTIVMWPFWFVAVLNAILTFYPWLRLYTTPPQTGCISGMHGNRHSSHSMRQGLCNGAVSVRPSVRLSQLSTAAAACGGFAAVGAADRRYRSIVARPAPAARRTAVSRFQRAAVEDWTQTSFTARPYASPVFAVVVCPSVRLSQSGIVSKRLDESSWVLP